MGVGPKDGGMLIVKVTPSLGVKGAIQPVMRTKTG